MFAFAVMDGERAGDEREMLERDEMDGLGPVLVAAVAVSPRPRLAVVLVLANRVCWEDCPGRSLESEAALMWLSGWSSSSESPPLTAIALGGLYALACRIEIEPSGNNGGGGAGRDGGAGLNELVV